MRTLISMSAAGKPEDGQLPVMGQDILALQPEPPKPPASAAGIPLPANRRRALAWSQFMAGATVSDVAKSLRTTREIVMHIRGGMPPECWPVIEAARAARRSAEFSAKHGLASRVAAVLERRAA